MNQDAANALKKQSQNALLQSLLTLLHEKTYDSISITDICNHSGFSRQTFYRHFESKDQLLQQHLHTLMNKLYSKINNLPNKNLEYSLLELFQFWSRHRNLTAALIKSDTPYISIPLMILFIQKTQLDNLLPQQKKCDISIHFLAGSLYSVIQFWVNSNYSPSSKDLSKQFISLLSAI